MHVRPAVQLQLLRAQLQGGAHLRLRGPRRVEVLQGGFACRERPRLQAHQRGQSGRRRA